ncbi:hypothetical protein PAMC26510_02235 [Caballeronia sordidicola]|jgi:hypothetical protein|uniref:Uncharacterized protein n=1 Tax=Caballeronia sordidicola TaxID=196367 RepID=A0A242N2I7_CABSO|nr:hypothetical protein PAMC26577_07150 [Caballeronia sordidicola]OTP80438.1 hypothetical protein PAMC26510_02235 [Caballeronia sordidicola]
MGRGEADGHDHATDMDKNVQRYAMFKSGKGKRPHMAAFCLFGVLGS